ncbi:MAG: radical SAM protein [Clostridiales bacterium]|nr:radical SAM protein [Clostridiales bacterium]
MQFTIPAKTIVSARLQNGWFGADYNMNIYKGCCHGCIYCDSRSDCYGVENFDTVRHKENALEVIEADLRRKRQTGMILTGSMSDPYNPFEQELRLSRGALSLIERYGFGVAVHTKSPLITRDIDLLQAIARHAPICVSMTITTADDALCRKIEQNIAPSGERFAALSKLSAAGISCGVLLMPLLPFINDTPANILAIVRGAHASGAKWIHCFMGLTLRANQRTHYYAKLDERFSGVKKRYIQTYGEAYSCPVPNQKELWNLFTAECRRLGLLYRMADIKEFIWSRYRERRLF